MAITAAEIQNVSFSIDRKGYDVDEVDVFLEHVAEEIDTMNQRIEGLVAELDAKEAEIAAAAEAAAAPAPVAAAIDVAAGDDDTDDAATLKARIADLEAKLAEKTANDSAISQALIVAQRSADEIVANERAEASNIIKDADEEADRIVGKAEADRLKITDSIRTLEADRSDVRAEYREMLSNFMADAQRKLAEIDGDARRANVTAPARAEANASAYAAPVAAQPAATAAPAAAAKQAATPAASGYIDKDFSGYGAADSDFAFDDID